MRIKKICFIGYGEHVEKTLIPSLNLNNKNIKIVTKKKLNNFQTFSSAQIALKNLTRDYIFFNSTPPIFHYSLSKLILSSGFNLIVEKPMCLNSLQVKKLYDLAKKNNVFIFENMMYFYSQQFKLIKKVINKKNIDSIDIKFAIPDFNLNSFRTNSNLKSSILYDMGCYPFSLLAYFNFNLKNFKIRYRVKKKCLIFLEVYFVAKKIKFNIICAVFQKYENFLKVNFKNFTSCKFNYVFYGKKVKKENFYYKLGKKIKITTIKEKNIFQNIFSFTKKNFLNLSKTQHFVIKNYLNNLNKIEKVIKL
ncbi:MviM Predicted dehydrogenases and related proteins [Candidatus Pelagibacterales bacterium]